MCSSYKQLLYLCFIQYIINMINILPCQNISNQKCAIKQRYEY